MANARALSHNRAVLTPKRAWRGFFDFLLAWMRMAPRLVLIYPFSLVVAMLIDAVLWHETFDTNTIANITVWSVAALVMSPMTYWLLPDPRRMVSRQIRRLNLPTSSLLVVLVFAVTIWFLRPHSTLFGNLQHKSSAPSVDVTKLALAVSTMIALVITYRRQRDQEQSRFLDRFGAAAAQLGATDVAVRMAGVYAMAGVADEADGLGRQQCIDVLCGYLRLPYDPEFGENHQTSRVKKTPNDSPETEDHFEYRQNDREVRKTVTRVIAAHLTSTAESWHKNDFDLRGACLVEVDFSKCYFEDFEGEADLRESTFIGDPLFPWKSDPSKKPPTVLLDPELRVIRGR